MSYHDQDRSLPANHIPTDIKQVTVGNTSQIAVFSNGGGVYGWQPYKEEVRVQEINVTPGHKEWLSMRTGNNWFKPQEQSERLTVLVDNNVNFQAIVDKPSTSQNPYYGIEDFTDNKPHEAELNRQKREVRTRLKPVVKQQISEGKAFSIDPEENIWLLAADDDMAAQTSIKGVPEHPFKIYKKPTQLVQLGSHLVVKVDSEDDKLTYINPDYRRVKTKPLFDLPFDDTHSYAQVIRTGTGKDASVVRSRFNKLLSEAKDPFESEQKSVIERTLEERRLLSESIIESMPPILANYLRDRAIPQLREQQSAVSRQLLRTNVNYRVPSIPDVITACGTSFSEDEIAQFMSMDPHSIMQYAAERESYNPEKTLSIAKNIAFATGYEYMGQEIVGQRIKQSHREMTALSINSTRQGENNDWKNTFFESLPHGLNDVQIKKLTKMIFDKSIQSVSDAKFLKVINVLTHYLFTNQTENDGLSLLHQDTWTSDDLQRFQSTPRPDSDQLLATVDVNKKYIDRFTRKPEKVSLGREKIRDDIPTNEGPFHVFTEYKVQYPESVVGAMARKYREYNEAFRELVDKNREWDTDYMYALTQNGMPINFGVQMDINGLTHEFLQEAKHMTEDEAYDRLNGWYEIENSLAMYGLLMRITSKNGEVTPFETGFRSTLDSIRKKHGKKIALLAVTDAKYNHMREAEFGKKPDEELTDQEVMDISGFDMFQSSDEFIACVEQNGGEYPHLAYVRSSDPLKTLEDPTNKVDHPLLSNEHYRREIKKNSLTFNIDNPDWPSDSDRRINDTKRYQEPIGMAYIIHSAAELNSDGLKMYLRKRGIDDAQIASGQAVVRGKPNMSYGCYGHERGAIGDSFFINSLDKSIRQRGGAFTIQPEEIVTTVQDQDTGRVYTVTDRVFFSTDGEKYELMEGFRSMMPVDTVEAKNGRNHGSDHTRWARITQALQ